MRHFKYSIFYRGRVEVSLIKNIENWGTAASAPLYSARNAFEKENFNYAQRHSITPTIPGNREELAAL